jgi:hypothetical protein
MSVQVSYPGVYIDEFAPGAPIEGVGTSTAAFIGLAAAGDLNVPEKITSFDAFKDTFGRLPAPGFYLWYAVQGFFQNGGQVCFVVRASNGGYDQLTLNNPAGRPAIVVRAIKPGAHNAGANPNPIQVQVTAAHAVPAATPVFLAPGTLANASVVGDRSITLTAGQAINFKPGDWLSIDVGPADQRVLVTSVAGDTVQLAGGLAAAHAANTAVRLADAPIGTQTIRIQPAAALPPNALVPGTLLTITQGANTDAQTIASVRTEPVAAGQQPTYRVTFEDGLRIALVLTAANAATVQSEEFNLLVSQGAGPATTYSNLAMDPTHPRYFASVINGTDTLVQLDLPEPPAPDAPPRNLPVAVGPVPLINGADENLSTMTAVNYMTALDTLRQIDEVNIVSVPDAVTLRGANAQATQQAIATVQQAVIAHCELLADRFGVLDSEPGVRLFGDQNNRGVDQQRNGLDSTRGYAALYYPWLCVAPALGGDSIAVPPSGHICGVMARTDITRGVFKAPSGIDGNVAGAVDVQQHMSNIDQGQLNLIGVNVVRVFKTGGRPVVWGARTTATDRNWQYVNIRRLFLYLEESIQEGILWAVFEPNNYSLWQKLKLTISAFLRERWREGALFGDKEEHAFYVRIDEVLNPFSEQALGRLHIEIGVRPSYPAEFIIVRIGIWDGGSEITES